jgi:hypothetical protein
VDAKVMRHKMLEGVSRSHRSQNAFELTLRRATMLRRLLRGHLPNSFPPLNCLPSSFSQRVSKPWRSEAPYGVRLPGRRFTQVASRPTQSLKRTLFARLACARHSRSLARMTSRVRAFRGWLGANTRLRRDLISYPNSDRNTCRQVFGLFACGTSDLDNFRTAPRICCQLSWCDSASCKLDNCA